MNAFDEPTAEELEAIEARKAEIEAVVRSRFFRPRGDHARGVSKRYCRREAPAVPATPAGAARRAIREYRRAAGTIRELVMGSRLNGLATTTIGPADIIEEEGAGPPAASHVCPDCGCRIGGRGKRHRLDCPRALARGQSAPEAATGEDAPATAPAPAAAGDVLAELQAMRAIVEALEGVGQEARRRVLAWVVDRCGRS